MKKTSLIFMCVLLCLFCFSSVSYSEDDDKLLRKYGKELIENAHKARDNTDDIHKILKTIGYDKMSNSTMGFYLRNIQNSLLWSCDMILLFRKAYKLDNQVSEWVTGRLRSLKISLKRDLAHIDKGYGNVKAVSLLHILDKQRDIIRSSLETLDNTIRLIIKIDTK